MEGIPPIENVIEAIHTLYKSPNTNDKEKASNWLGELQQSVYAWKTADDLLHRKLDLESCYFAAQTMRMKIQNSFHELPENAHGSLRDSLLIHIRQVTEETNSVIVTQLCLALADMVLQMPSWTAPINNLIELLGAEHRYALIEILTLLPEEVNSRYLRLGSNRRTEILGHFNESGMQVLNLLRVYYVDKQNNSEALHIRLIKCFRSWISVLTVPTQDILDNEVFISAFQALSTQESSGRLHEVAADCVCSLLESVQNNNNQDDLHLKLYNGISTLLETYHMTVAAEDMDKIVNYCRIFTELGESMLLRIINNATEQNSGLGILDLVLTCVGHHDYEVASITFNLWFRLSEELYQKGDDNLNNVFRPYVEKLLSALCRHCQMEPDVVGVMDEKDEFANFRMKVSELVKDVVFIVGSSTIFRQMFMQLQSSSATWDSTEASLYIMQAVARNILPEEREVVPKVVEAILNMPKTTHIAVCHTSIILLGELCEWIERHLDILDMVLNFCMYCLQQPQLATAAATSLQNICSACRDHMSGHFDGLVQLVESLDKIQISNSAAIGLLKGVTVILGRMSLEQIRENIQKICRVQVTPLLQLLEAETTSDSKIPKDTVLDPSFWLDRLAAIFRHTNPTVSNGDIHPCLPIITELWPVISQVCTKYKSDMRIMEKCCRCVRFMIRCVGKQSSPLLEPIVKLIVTTYQSYQHSCFLYLGSILVDEYASEPACVPGLMEMLNALLPVAFKLFETNNGLISNPDTVDDLFRLCTRFLQRSPVTLLQSEIMENLIRCGLMAVHLEHREANSSVQKFFYDFIHCARRHEDHNDFSVRRSLVERLLKEFGQKLVSELIIGAVFRLPTYTLPEIADTFMELISLDRAVFCVWLETALKSLHEQNVRGTVNATQKQLVKFHASVTSAENSRMIAYALRDFTKLYR